LFFNKKRGLKSGQNPRPSLPFVGADALAVGGATGQISPHEFPGLVLILDHIANAASPSADAAYTTSTNHMGVFLLKAKKNMNEAKAEALLAAACKFQAQTGV
jgi:hypothetical protein